MYVCNTTMETMLKVKQEPVNDGYEEVPRQPVKRKFKAIAFNSRYNLRSRPKIKLEPQDDNNEIQPIPSVPSRSVNSSSKSTSFNCNYDLRPRLHIKIEPEDYTDEIQPVLAAVPSKRETKTEKRKGKMYVKVCKSPLQPLLVPKVTRKYRRKQKSQSMMKSMCVNPIAFGESSTNHIEISNVDKCITKCSVKREHVSDTLRKKRYQQRLSDQSPTIIQLSKEKLCKKKSKHMNSGESSRSPERNGIPLMLHNASKNPNFAVPNSDSRKVFSKFFASPKEAETSICDPCEPTGARLFVVDEDVANTRVSSSQLANSIIELDEPHAKAMKREILSENENDFVADQNISWVPLHKLRSVANDCKISGITQEIFHQTVNVKERQNILGASLSHSHDSIIHGESGFVKQEPLSQPLVIADEGLNQSVGCNYLDTSEHEVTSIETELQGQNGYTTTMSESLDNEETAMPCLSAIKREMLSQERQKILYNSLSQPEENGMNLEPQPYDGMFVEQQPLESRESFNASVSRSDNIMTDLDTMNHEPTSHTVGLVQLRSNPFASQRQLVDHFSESGTGEHDRTLMSSHFAECQEETALSQSGNSYMDWQTGENERDLAKQEPMSQTVSQSSLDSIMILENVVNQDYSAIKEEQLSDSQPMDLGLPTCEKPDERYQGQYENFVCKQEYDTVDNFQLVTQMLEELKFATTEVDYSDVTVQRQMSFNPYYCSSRSRQKTSVPVMSLSELFEVPSVKNVSQINLSIDEEWPTSSSESLPPLPSNICLSQSENNGINTVNQQEANKHSPPQVNQTSENTEPFVQSKKIAVVMLCMKSHLYDMLKPSSSPSTQAVLLKCVCTSCGDQDISDLDDQNFSNYSITSSDSEQPVGTPDDWTCPSTSNRKPYETNECVDANDSISSLVSLKHVPQSPSSSQTAGDKFAALTQDEQLSEYNDSDFVYSSCEEADISSSESESNYIVLPTQRQLLNSFYREVLVERNMSPVESKESNSECDDRPALGQNIVVFSDSEFECEQGPKKSPFISRSDLADIRAGMYDVFSPNGRERELPPLSSASPANSHITDCTIGINWPGRVILAKTPSGQLCKIKIDLLRPASFPDADTCMRWDEAVARNSRKLKMQLREGSLTVEQYLQNTKRIMQHQAAKLEEAQDKRKGKFKLVKWLTVECRMLEIDREVRLSLGLNSAKIDDCLPLLDELAAMHVDPLMLKKHPLVVETVKKLRRYVGNLPCWKLSEEEELEFKQKANQVRQKAEFIYNKLKSLFVVPPTRSFWEVFTESVKVFMEKTRDLDLDLVYKITDESERSEELPTGEKEDVQSPTPRESSQNNGDASDSDEEVENRPPLN